MQTNTNVYKVSVRILQWKFWLTNGLKNNVNKMTQMLSNVHKTLPYNIKQTTYHWTKNKHCNEPGPVQAEAIAPLSCLWLAAAYSLVLHTRVTVATWRRNTTTEWN